MLLKRILDGVMTSGTFHKFILASFQTVIFRKTVNLFFLNIKCTRAKGLLTLLTKFNINVAYDTIWRDGLIYKKLAIGITGGSQISSRIDILVR